MWCEKQGVDTALSRSHQLVSARKVQMDAPVLGLHTESSRGVHSCTFNAAPHSSHMAAGSRIIPKACMLVNGYTICLPGSWTTSISFSQAPSSKVFRVYSGICDRQTLSAPPHWRTLTKEQVNPDIDKFRLEGLSGALPAL